MNHFEFEHPWAFLLLILIICIYKCPVAIKKIIFPHTNLFSISTNFLNLQKLLYSLILALMVTAIASPITYDQKNSNKRKGRDLVFALDTSGSMAESGFDNENTQSKKFDILIKLLKEFVSNRYDDNVGISIFGSYAYAAIPLTYDMNSINFLIDFLEVGIAGDSTAIGEGLSSATKILQKGEAKNKIIVLITDGYQNSGAISIKDATMQAKKLGVKIYTIGIGKKTDFDSELLTKISKDTNAKSYEAQNAQMLKEIYGELNSIEPSNIRSQHYLNKQVLYIYPLAIAGMLLLYLIYRGKHR